MKYDKLTKYNKLVRDKIPEIVKAKGKDPVIHIAKNEEYWLKLKEKLAEEVDEFLEAESEEELADILEVLEAIYKYKNYSEEDILKLKKEKAKERGGFSKKIILEQA